MRGTCAVAGAVYRGSEKGEWDGPRMKPLNFTRPGLSPIGFLHSQGNANNEKNDAAGVVRTTVYLPKSIT